MRGGRVIAAADHSVESQKKEWRRRRLPQPGGALRGRAASARRRGFTTTRTTAWFSRDARPTAMAGDLLELAEAEGRRGRGGA